MTNWILIKEAVELVSNLLAAEGAYELPQSIEKRCLDWYNHSEITDPEMLAAAALNGPYNPEFTWDDLLALRNFFFPPMPLDLTEISVQEIKEALFDEDWR